MKFSKIQLESLQSKFVLEVQKKIFSGELKAGTRLPPERELAAEVGISRGVVHSGILELASQGFLRIAPRKGTFVSDLKSQATLSVLEALMNYKSGHIDHALFESMMDARRLIEGESARLAALRASTAEISQFSGAIDGLERLDDLQGQVESIVRLHFTLTQLSGNPVYAMFFKSFEPVVYRLTMAHFSMSRDRDQTVAYLRSLAGALQARDGEKAKKVLQDGLSLGIAVLEKIYE